MSAVQPFTQARVPMAGFPPSLLRGRSVICSAVLTSSLNPCESLVSDSTVWDTLRDAVGGAHQDRGFFVNTSLSVPPREKTQPCVSSISVGPRSLSL